MDGLSLARRVLSAIACLMGAAGVAAAAGAAHGGGGGPLAAASLLLLVHAPAILALGSVAGHTPLGLVAMAGMAAGPLLFSADMAMRTWQSSALFPMAAPIGGTTTILAWLLAALALVTGRSR